MKTKTRKLTINFHHRTCIDCPDTFGVRYGGDKQTRCKPCRIKARRDKIIAANVARGANGDAPYEPDQAEIERLTAEIRETWWSDEDRERRDKPKPLETRVIAVRELGGAVKLKQEASVSKPIVYIASPYTRGDPCINTHFQMRLFDALMDGGVVIPYVPLWSHFQHTAFPRPYQDWIDYDNAIIPRLDACLQADSIVEHLNYHVRTWESRGVQAEVKLFESLGKPVFSSVEALYDWATQRNI